MNRTVIREGTSVSKGIAKGAIRSNVAAVKNAGVAGNRVRGGILIRPGNLGARCYS